MALLLRVFVAKEDFFFVSSWQKMLEEERLLLRVLVPQLFTVRGARS